MAIYESFFRTFCIFPQVQVTYLRANRNSLKEGFKFWYGGRSNDVLSDLLYYTLGNGKENTLIKFS